MLQSVWIAFVSMDLCKVLANLWKLFTRVFVGCCRILNLEDPINPKTLNPNRLKVHPFHNGILGQTMTTSTHTVSMGQPKAHSDPIRVAAHPWATPESRGRVSRKLKATTPIVVRILGYVNSAARAQTLLTC